MMLASAIFVSCQSAADKYVHSFERFVSKVEKEADGYTVEVWEQKDKEFEKYTNEKFEKIERKLTSSERKKIGELNGRYCKVRAKAYGEEFIDVLGDGLDYLDGFVNGLLNSNDDNENKDK